MPTSLESLAAWGVPIRAAAPPPPSAALASAGRDESGSANTIVELPPRSVLSWTPEDVGTAIITADTGNLRTAADLTERVMADARVRGIMSTRTHGLFGLPMNFNGPAAQVEALKGTDDAPGSWWKMFPENELAKFTSWGIMLGVGVAQRLKDEKRKIGAEDVPVLKTWHPRWLRYQYPTRVTREQWYITTADGEIPIDPDSGEWILYRPYGDARPWAEGAWRALSEAWILKQYAKHDRARYAEVHGSPLRVGTAPQGANQRTRERWRDSLRALGKDTSMVLPEGYTMELIEATGGQGVVVYRETIDLSDQDIAICLTGQTVTTTGTTGFSKGSIHETIAHDLVKFTADSLSSCLRDGGLAPWAATNYGNPDLAPYQAWDIKKPEDKKVAAETLKLFGDGVVAANVPLAAVGKRLDVTQLAEDFGLDLEDLPKTDTKAASVPLAPTDLAKIMTVNEGRAGSGLGPLKTATGADDPDGYLSITEFDAKRMAAQKPTPVIVAPGQPHPDAPGGKPPKPADPPPADPAKDPEVPPAKKPTKVPPATDVGARHMRHIGAPELP